MRTGWWSELFATHCVYKSLWYKGVLKHSNKGLQNPKIQEESLKWGWNTGLRGKHNHHVHLFNVNKSWMALHRSHCSQSIFRLTSWLFDPPCTLREASRHWRPSPAHSQTCRDQEQAAFLDHSIQSSGVFSTHWNPDINKCINRAHCKWEWMMLEHLVLCTSSVCVYSQTRTYSDTFNIYITVYSL